MTLEDFLFVFTVVTTEPALKCDQVVSSGLNNTLLNVSRIYGPSVFVNHPGCLSSGDLLSSSGVTELRASTLRNKGSSEVL